MPVSNTFHIPVTQSELPWALRQGSVAGVTAGVVFIVFEIVVSAVMMGPEAALMPLRMIGAILLGPDALQPTYSIVLAVAAGLVVHLVLAIIYGVIFAVVAGGIPSPGWDIGLGAIYGVVLWLVNFYVIAPIIFPWFLEANPGVQFIAHTFFFGAILGWYLSWAPSRDQMGLRPRRSRWTGGQGNAP